MRLSIGSQAFDVGFPVWDAVTELAYDPEGGAAAGASDRLDGVSVVRGRPPLERGDPVRPGLVVWSFDPAVLARDRAFATRLTALAFVQPLQARTGEPVAAVVEHVMALIGRAGEPVTLTAGERRVPGEVFAFDGVGVLAVSGTPDAALTAACFGSAGVPAFRRLALDAPA